MALCQRARRVKISDLGTRQTEQAAEYPLVILTERGPSPPIAARSIGKTNAVAFVATFTERRVRERDEMISVRELRVVHEITEVGDGDGFDSARLKLVRDGVTMSRRAELAHDGVDFVDVFRASDAVPEVVESTIRIGCKALWLQEGVAHEEASLRAEAAGVFVVRDSCILKEHRRFQP